VERRELLALLLRAGTAPAWAMVPRELRSQIAQLPIEDQRAPEAIIAITGGYRQLDDSTASPELLPLALGHLQYASGTLRRSATPAHRARLAAAASEAAGLVGSVAFDNGNHDLACANYEASITFADQSGNDLLRAFSLGMMSCFRAETGHGSKAVSLLEKGRALLPKDAPPTIEARMGTYEANVYARAGDRPMALAALARVDAASERIGRDEEMFWPLVFPFDSARLERERGACATRLGISEIALSALRTGLSAIGSAPTKRRAVVLCDLAESYTRTGEIEEACRHALEALAIGLQMDSYRILQRVGGIRRALTPWKDAPAVAELEDRLMEGLLRRHTADRSRTP
jgi:tetratricopeptide (TPR) repeat protein